jgi:hypothetical protein
MNRNNDIDFFRINSHLEELRSCNTWFSYFSVIIKQKTNLFEKI